MVVMVGYDSIDSPFPLVHGVTKGGSPKIQRINPRELLLPRRMLVGVSNAKDRQDREISSFGTTLVSSFDSSSMGLTTLGFVDVVIQIPALSVICLGMGYIVALTTSCDERASSSYGSGPTSTWDGARAS
jgi:hypothetical protein